MCIEYACDVSVPTSYLLLVCAASEYSAMSQTPGRFVKRTTESKFASPRCPCVLPSLRFALSVRAMHWSRVAINTRLALIDGNLDFVFSEGEL